MSPRTLASFLACLVVVPTFASSATRCPDGRFAVTTPLQPGSGPAVDTVVLDGATVALAGCTPARLHTRRTRIGMSLRARWNSCAALGGPVRLKARVDRACGRMTGVVHARGIVPWRFLATRTPVCGNGVLEGDEECDLPSACCSTSCRAIDDPACTPRPCSSEAACGTGTFCVHDAACGGPGTCRPRPDACVDVLDPVCGCDEHSYRNACEAARAGTDILHDGRCARTCGTIAGIGCPKGSFCEFPGNTCGAADWAGTCVEVPQLCPRIYRPVCGCDGNTYGNDCTRQAAGVSRAHEGTCDSRCATNAECAASERCAKPAGACNRVGGCTVRPELCIQLYAPVCGCDGHTYSNACAAAASGANVFGAGVCRATD